MNLKLKGTLFGIVAAVSYAVNPLGALFLYREGINTHSVLFYRFFLAAIILGVALIWYKKSFFITFREGVILGVLGALFGVSSLSLFASFHHMSVGLACTLLFVYPIMVAAMMTVFFKERLAASTVLSTLLAFGGMWLLYAGGGQEGSVSLLGVFLVLLSAFTYALYMIVINKLPLTMPAMKLTFYVLIFCVLTIMLHSFWDVDTQLQLLHTPKAWAFAILLALVPTLISLITMLFAVHMIGSTPTAILGALEPVAAVAIGILVFDETMTLPLATGIMLILSAVILIVLGKANTN